MKWFVIFALLGSAKASAVFTEVYCRSGSQGPMDEIPCTKFLDAFSTNPGAFVGVYRSKNEKMVSAYLQKVLLQRSALAKLTPEERKAILASARGPEGQRLTPLQIDLILHDSALDDKRNFWRSNDTARVRIINASPTYDSFIIKESSNTAWGGCILDRKNVSPLSACDPILKDIGAAYYEGFKTCLALCGEDFPRECMLRNP